MRKPLQKTFSLLLAAALVTSTLTGSAFAAKSDKSDKAGKTDKETASAATVITLADAKGIALGDAGVAEADAVFSKEKLDKAVYELKFSTPAAKYEYEISAADGSILSSEMEAVKSHHTSSPVQRPALKAAVSPEQARQIALDDAGLGADFLGHVTCYVSWVDHAPYAYEVKFSVRAGYYHYTIDLTTGAILNDSFTPHR